MSQSSLCARRWGLAALLCAVRLGGLHQSLDVRSLALIRETLARWASQTSLLQCRDWVLAQSRSSVTRSKSQIVPAVCRGEKIAAFALTEPESGSDVASIETRAEEADSGWVLNGSKTYISNGGIADYYVLFARTGEAPGAKGLSAFIVDRHASGLDDSERIEVIAPHPLAAIRMTNMRLPGRIVGRSRADCTSDEHIGRLPHNSGSRRAWVCPPSAG